MGRLQLLQLDSVPIVIRTQYMPLFSRLGAYRPGLLDEIAYQSDEWFETWSHEASLLPVAMEPWLRWSKRRAQEGDTWKHLHTFAKKDPAYVDAVLGEVKARGPLAAADLSDPRPRSVTGWGRGSGGAIALDWLFRIGRLGVRRSKGFAKRFDLLERIIPESIRALPTPSFSSALDELLLRSARAHGIGTAHCLVDYFRLPVRPAKARLDALVEDGKLIACEVEGWSRSAYRHPDSKLPRAIKRAALLSPFDPLVWNRKRITGLFDFDYRIEIYTPAEKRKYGYYVLPFLLGDRLVARFDLKTNRDRGTLEVLAAHVEAGVEAAEVASAAVLELEELALLVGVERVSAGRKGNLATLIRKHVNRAK